MGKIMNSPKGLESGVPDVELKMHDLTSYKMTCIYLQYLSYMIALWV